MKSGLKWYSKISNMGKRVLQFFRSLRFSAIYEVGPTPLDDSDEMGEGGGGSPGSSSCVVSNNQFRIATAIYPSASMMNHSCDPSVINSFCGSRIIVKAIKPVPKVTL